MKTTKILILVLALCMATTALLGGSIARFSASDFVGDNAQVSQWGVMLKVNGDLYGSKYLNAASENAATKDNANITVTSLSEGTPNVVAPGTAGNKLTVSLSGSAEVAVTKEISITTQNVYLTAGTYAIMDVNTNVTAENFDDLKATLYTNTGTADAPIYTKVTGDFVSGTPYYQPENVVTLTNNYYPVVYTANTVAPATNLQTDTLLSIAQMMAVGVNATYSTTTENGKTTLTATSAVIDAGTALKLYDTTESLDISWAWAIDNGSSDAEKETYGLADTVLGKLATNNNTVVMLDNSGNATTLSVNTTTGLVKKGSETVASLKTSLKSRCPSSQLSVSVPSRSNTISTGRFMAISPAEHRSMLCPQ